MKPPYKPWTALKPGDMIDVIAPGRGCSEKTLEELREFITSLGYEPRIPEHIFGKDPFSSNSDEIRSEHLQQALLAEDSKAVWPVKGGYGTTRLIPDLMKLKKPKHTKLIMGFSDITALHYFLQNQWGWCSVHTKVLNQFNSKLFHDPSLPEIRDLLSGHKHKWSYHISPLNDAAKKSQTIETAITGGNVKLTQVTLNTPWQVQPDNKIVFLEDVDERGYALDRVFTQFLQIGLLDKAKALILGDFTEGKEPDGKTLVYQAIHRFVDDLAIPVLSVEGIGHDRTNHPLPLGTRAELILGENPTLTVDTGAIT